MAEQPVTVYITPDWRVALSARVDGSDAWEYRTKDALGADAWLPIERAPFTSTIKVPLPLLVALGKRISEIPSDAAEVVLAMSKGGSPVERELLTTASDKLRLDWSWMSNREPEAR